MKTSKLLITTLFFLIFSTFLNAQSCSVPELLNIEEAVGAWEGSFLEDGKILPVRILISKNGEELQSEISLGNNKAKLAETELCAQEDLHLKIKQGTTQYEFRGKPKNGEISGMVILTPNEGSPSNKVFSVKKI